MIVIVPSALAKNRVSRSARSFADSRKTADPRTEKRSLLVNRDKQPAVVHRPDGSTINFTYDGAGRLSTVTYPKGPDVSDGTVTVTRTYNPTTGKLASVSTSDGQTVTYGYDGRLPLSTTWSGTVAGSVSRTYNNDFRVVSESVNGANSVAFGYDNDGLLTSAAGLSITRDPTNGLITDTALGQVTEHRTYDSFALLATDEVKFGTTSLYSVSYTRDAVGRIEQRTETIQGSATVWVYSYDSAGRLWQVMKDGVLSATYLYDANGNRTAVTTPNGTETATYDDQDRLLSYGKWSYTYTANGELRTKTNTNTGELTRYTYDGAENLRKVELPGGTVVEYVIDFQSRRVAKKVNGTIARRWVYRDLLHPIAELNGTGAVSVRYGEAAMVTAAGTSAIVGDHLGSPRLVVDAATGAIRQRIDYDEWGRVVTDTSAGLQAFGFAGGIYDPDTGLVRFGARDYDAEVGRWVVKDPVGFLGGTLSLYSYVNSDPINRTDRSGLGYPTYGLPRAFWNWWDKCPEKQGRPRGNLSREEARELYDYWKSEGKPDREGHRTDKPGGDAGGVCEEPNASAPMPADDSPEQCESPDTGDADPTPPKNSGNNPTTTDESDPLLPLPGIDGAPPAIKLPPIRIRIPEWIWAF